VERLLGLHVGGRVRVLLGGLLALWLLARSSRVDRALGAVVGGAKAMLALWVLLSALALWGRPIHLAGWDVDPRGSELVAFAGEHSALHIGRAFHGDGESKGRARGSGAQR
jgi:hypothetical protein